MGQPFQLGPPPHDPALPPGSTWGAPTGPQFGQSLPGYPSGRGRGAADAIAAAGSALAAMLYLARRIWSFIQFDKFFWSDVVLLFSVLFTLVAAVLLITARKHATARIAGGIAAGMMLVPNAAYVFGAFDRSFRAGHSAWEGGGWLSIPATLLTLAAIGALFAASSTAGPQHVAGPGFQPPNPPPASPWPYPPMGQPPAAYPGHYQPPPPQ
ncbi:hypothetical protein [Nocardia asiatica]|uniref:hypothetical protein n=1 Tax=Nocardia asiatica TaxID=209252 RepID=UPI00030ECAF0|nr:hypothetical protein [Nocardia asiatica]